MTEHAANLYTQQSNNVFKTWILMILFSGLIGAIGYAFSWYFQTPILFYGFLGFSLLTNFFSYWNSAKLALRQSGAVEVPKEGQYEELHRIVENLAITAGLPKPSVHVIADPSPNAFATGRNKEHAAIAVTTGLLDRLDRTELEGVIAHEMAHIGNRDILVMTVAVVLAGFVALAAEFFGRGILFSGGNSDDNRSNLIGIGIAIGLSILAPLFASLIQFAVSRRREFLADATGALLTRYPEGLASALEKISSSSAPLARANNATAHLYISNPFGADRPQHQAISFISNLFMTHPPVEQRVAALRGMEL